MKITEEIFKEIDTGQVFAVGIEPNSPDGIYMTNYNIGKSLLWIAIKGFGDDWTIYCGWLDSNSIYELKKHGDKVHSHEHIIKCVDCSAEVLEKYRG